MKFEHAESAPLEKDEQIHYVVKVAGKGCAG